MHALWTIRLLSRAHSQYRAPRNWQDMQADHGADHLKVSTMDALYVSESCTHQRGCRRTLPGRWPGSSTPCKWTTHIAKTCLRTGRTLNSKYRTLNHKPLNPLKIKMCWGTCNMEIPTSGAVYNSTRASSILDVSEQAIQFAVVLQCFVMLSLPAVKVACPTHQPRRSLVMIL